MGFLKWAFKDPFLPTFYDFFLILIGTLILLQIVDNKGLIQLAFFFLQKLSQKVQKSLICPIQVDLPPVQLHHLLPDPESCYL